ncbi:hypothetical protein NSQ96_17055 [Caldifermentibacillus hisashii]|jgi:hypothetical protein|uniref:Uncharacterized protein n=2 Tax=Bacillaceae TaxID=186817 RepID=A0A090KW85_9BACI|nr:MULTISPECIES: hypothetical protein [Bacillaceae]MCB7070848.1 hypothetical protein [Caldibacillus sp. 210928-DFI.2.22]MCB7074335.1 hypothetical protein [Caldibacillus sp. 210928-DFI.2.18]MEC5273145.1 hypothetical protein [Caldifermentibacillus hisashii]PAC36672.1 hypothetical protein CEJ87_05570 [Caldifermentibacillus hisashii]CEE02984.1 hypothetical protein BT1A1_3201 [Caldibacillus thermoamylovorans]
MEKDIKEIVKAAAERYGIEYNENQLYPRIRHSNGEIIELSKEKFIETIGISFINNQNWSKNPEIEKMVWENTEIGFYLTDNIESDYVIDKNIGTNTAA